jgi:hypothetical protein
MVTLGLEPIALVALLAAFPAPSSQQQPRADQSSGADAKAVEDFRHRIEQYVKVHKEAARESPPLKVTDDPARIKTAADGLAAQIRAARAGARHGDIFTPAITDVFRRLLAPELQGEDGRDAKAILKDDAPTSVPLRVNAKYPENQPLPTVPAGLLLELPPLPEELEYRIVGRHLILRDAAADIIVDYIPNAIR